MHTRSLCQHSYIISQKWIELEKILLLVAHLLFAEIISFSDGVLHEVEPCTPYSPDIIFIIKNGTIDWSGGLKKIEYLRYHASNRIRTHLFLRQDRGQLYNLKNSFTSSDNVDAHSDCIITYRSTTLKYLFNLLYICF